MTVKDNVKALREVSKDDVETLFANNSDELHRKVDQTRDAYLGFIFPVNRSDYYSVATALDINGDTAQVLFKRGREFSNFRVGDRPSQITNHIFGTSILALRNKPLDSGLATATDTSLEKLVKDSEETVLEIAEVRTSWFGRIFFPSTAFSNAIAVFGGKVNSEVFFELANRYGYSAMAGNRKTVRGDFGIAVWLTLLGMAP